MIVPETRSATASDGAESAAPDAESGADAAPAEAVLWQVGDVIADLYRVEQEVGSGGMGVVHRVHHINWNQDLAVKSPRRELWSGASGVRAFRNEAQVWIDLPSHPNICTCHYVRELDGIPRLFAEWVPGGSLADELRCGQLTTLSAVLDVAIQMAWGLAAAHESGIVHQDVKPANVLIAEDRTAKITDFGLARAQQRSGPPDRRRQLPAVGPTESVLVTRMGLTPAYASPEQFAGRRVGRRTDVWSWAVTVLEMFAGEMTWRAGPAAPEVLRSIVATAGSGRIALPADVAHLLQRCFAVDPAGRPDISTAAARLIDVYESQAGRLYPRTATVPVERQADGLNNKALSLLDLGQVAEAERCWQRGLVKDPRHADAVFNYGLFRWRKGVITDRELIRDLQAVCLARGRAGLANGLAEYLLGLVHLETGNAAEAAVVLGQAAELCPDKPEVDSAMRLAARQDLASPRDHVVLQGDGLEEHINCIAVNPAGTCAVGGCSDGRIGVWDLTDGTLVRTLVGHTGVIRAVSMTPDATLALSASNNGTLRFWDLGDGACLHVLNASDDGSFDVAMDPEGRYGVSTSERSVLVWDLKSGVRVRTFSSPAYVYALAVTPDFHVAVSGHGDNTVRVWDLTTGVCVRTLGEFGPDIEAVSVTPDGRYAVTGGSDGVLHFWDLQTGSLLSKLTGHAERVRSVAVAADGSYAVSCGWDTTIRLWDLTAGRCQRTYRRRGDASDAVELVPHQQQAVTAGVIGTANWWQLSPGAPASWSYSQAPSSAVITERQRDVNGLIEQSRQLIRQQDRVGAAKVLRRARAVPGYHLHEELLDMWYLAGNDHDRTALIDARETTTLPAEGSGGRRVALTHDGKFAFGVGKVYDCKLWDVTTGTELKRLTGHTGVVRAVAVSGNGDCAVSASSDQTVRVWDVQGEMCEHVLTGHVGPVSCAAIAPDGAVVVSGGDDKTTRVWDPATGRCLRTLTGHDEEIHSIALSADGSHVASATFETIRWWSTATGRCLRVITDDADGVAALTLSPDGRLLTVGSVYGTLITWDLAAEEKVSELDDGSRVGISAVRVTSDGQHAISANRNDTLSLWDFATGELLRVVDCHSSSIETMDATPDAHYALVGGTDGTAKLWRFDWEYDI